MDPTPNYGEGYPAPAPSERVLCAGIVDPERLPRTVDRPGWLARRRFLRAYRTLSAVAERHTEAKHNVEFVAVDETYIVLRCHTCTPQWTWTR